MKKILSFILCIVMYLSLQNPVYAFNLNAFGDVNFGESSEKGESPGFMLGQLDLWAKTNLDDKGHFNTIFELVIESSGSGFVADLERIWVGYRLSPRISVRAGRFHTALGYWNRTFHHGAFMQTSLFRPRFLEFEDGETGVLPVHIVGGMAAADLKTRFAFLHLELQLGNGSSVDQSDPNKRGEFNANNAGDADRAKGVAGRLFIRPTFIEALGLGLSLSANKVRKRDKSGSVSDLVDQTIYELDLTYIETVVSDVELLFEHYWVVNQSPSGSSHTSTFWYVQAGKKFRYFIMPYTRYEFFDNLDERDPYFSTLHAKTYTEFILGTRFDFDIGVGAETAVKLEARFSDEASRTNRSYWAQWAFGF